MRSASETVESSCVANSPSGSVSVIVGNGPSAVAVGDLDGDGKLDVAAANYWDDTVSIIQPLPSI